MTQPDTSLQAGHERVAVIGMAGRFPGAPNIEVFWQNLRAGVESIRALDPHELGAEGIAAAGADAPNYVRAASFIEGIEWFAAEFFDYSPREAAVIDPQQRLLLECAWETFENAGHDPRRFAGSIGVYAGAKLNTYLLHNLLPHSGELEILSSLTALIGNDKDYVAPRLAYALDLHGPAIGVQTACSTSLVAVHLACEALLNRECDMALAGGVSLRVPQKEGYLHQPGSILSPDGHCRAFDAAAAGTVEGNGLGLVLLRRLDDALADGDRVRAVIRGSALNNDGARKVGFSAPSVAGQAQVITEALAVADAAPSSIDYVETHGTGTRLGDPVEVKGLCAAFRDDHRAQGSCALGSVKTNIGHLDTAAGIAGFIKTVLALEHRELPPSLHFSSLNPEIDFSRSPFYVNAQLRAWDKPSGARRAGVSSFGIGGTNVHVVLEEAPRIPCSPAPQDWHLLVISAKSAAALDAVTTNLRRYLEAHPDCELRDVAYVLQCGRAHFSHARVALCCDVGDAVRVLASLEPGRVWSAVRGDSGAVAPRPDGSTLDRRAWLEALGQHWLAGSEIDWQALYTHQRPKRVSLPSYPFERQRYWIDPPSLQPTAALAPTNDAGAIERWFYQTSWLREAPLLTDDSMAASAANYVAWHGGSALELRLIDQLRGRAGELIVVDRRAPAEAESTQLAAALARATPRNWRVLDLRSLAPRPDSSSPIDLLSELAEVLRFAQVLGRSPADWRFDWLMLVRESQDVKGGEPLCPERAAIVAAMKVIGQEYPNVTTRVLDVAPPPDAAEEIFIERLLAHVTHGRTFAADDVLALRGVQLWRRWFTPCPLPAPNANALRERGVYLIVGGASGVGLELAEHLAQTTRARLALVSRSAIATSAKRAMGTDSGLDARVACSIAQATEREASARWPEARLARVRAFEQQLTVLCCSHALRYVRSSGLFENDGSSVAELCTALRVAPPYDRMLDALLGLLASHELLAIHAGRIQRLAAANALHEPEVLGSALRETFPEFAGLIDLLEHCAKHYPEVLSGELSGAGVLYPGGSPELLIEAQTRSAETTWHRSYAGALAEVVAALAERAQGRTLRVLEVGAGQGTLTRSILDRLGERRIDYHFTDISASFVRAAGRAAEREGKRDMRFGVLDISCDPSAQGFAAGSFDLVLGLDVVHATRDVSSSLAHLHGLVAPGGLLGLIESTQAKAWLTMTMGVTSGWWEYQDEALRQPLSPLLSARRWEELLRAQGFTEVRAFPAADDAAHVDCGLFLAQRPCDSQPSVRERLEAAGAEVLALDADVADVPAMQAALREVEQRWGAIHGVVHCAGVPDGAAVQARTLQSVEEVLRPKLLGTRVLARVLDLDSLDFCVLCSSLTAVRGGYGQFAHAAASAFLDAFAANQARRGPGTCVSIDWDAWRQVGQAARAMQAHSRVSPTQLEHMRRAIDPDSGREVFARTLTARAAQLLVSTTPLGSDGRFPSLPKLDTTEPERTDPAAAPDVHARPELPNPYRAPRGSLEVSVAEIWQRALGLDRVGADDNFFALGGDSLLGLEVIAAVNDRFQSALPAYSLLAESTLKTFADLLAVDLGMSPAAVREDPSRALAHSEQRQREQITSMSEEQVEVSIARELSDLRDVLATGADYGNK